MTKQTQTTVQNEQPKLPITATVTLKTRTFRDGSTNEYIAADLVNPFEGEDFAVEFSCKWKSDKGIFDYKARKLLQKDSSFTLTGYLTPVKFFSKRLQRDTFVVGCFFDNPFFAGELEFRIVSEEQYALLALYCSDAWGLKLSRYYDVDKQVSDESEE